MDETAETPPGGQGETPSRSELRLYGRALRNGWNLGPDIKAKVLRRVLNVLDEDHLHPADGALDDGQKQPLTVAGPRLAVAAARVVVAMDAADLARAAIDLKAQDLELKRKALELKAEEIEAKHGNKGEGPVFTDLVAEAEEIARKRRAERAAIEGPKVEGE